MNESVLSSHIVCHASNEVFVFGNNQQGMHDGDVRLGSERFGDVCKQGGLCGQTFPTVQGDVETVVEIGGGIYGCSVEKIAPLYIRLSKPI
jgi:hypothetical protein